jgi:FkbM family methyltransferase
MLRSLRDKGLKPTRVKETKHYLRRFDLRPEVVFDVGVHSGTPYLYRAFPDAQFVLIDPLPVARGLVEAASPPLHYDFHPVAAGAAAGTAMLSITETQPGKGGNLSGFHDREDVSRGWISRIEHREVPVVTLDSIAAGYPGVAGIKIDTEGHELEVLTGAAETLRRADFVIVELSVTRRFANATLPSSVIARLAEAGLELRDVLNMAPPDYDMPRHMEVLFTRWPVPQGRNTPGNDA